MVDVIHEKIVGEQAEIHWQHAEFCFLYLQYEYLNLPRGMKISHNGCLLTVHQIWFC